MIEQIKQQIIRVLICTAVFALVAPMYKAHIHGVQLTNKVIEEFVRDGALWGMVLSSFIALMTLWQTKSPHPFACLFTMIGGTFALSGFDAAQSGIAFHLLISAGVFTFHYLLAYFACYLASNGNGDLKVSN